MLRRHFPVLDRHDDLPRMIIATLDAARHDRMRIRTGGDATALAEIRTTQQTICQQSDPDLLSIARLARHRDDIHQRNHNIPTQLLSVLARLGQHNRAEAIAHSYSTPDHQAVALTQIAGVLAERDPDRAARLAERADALAHTITDPHVRASVLTQIAGVLAERDPKRAEAIAHTITDPDRQAVALTQIVEAVTRSARRVEEAAGCEADGVRGLGRPASETKQSSHRVSSRDLLALAWSLSGWEVPIQALAAVDWPVLDVPTADLGFR